MGCLRLRAVEPPAEDEGLNSEREHNAQDEEERRSQSEVFFLGPAPRPSDRKEEMPDGGERESRGLRLILSMTWLHGPKRLPHRGAFGKRSASLLTDEAPAL